MNGYHEEELSRNFKHIGIKKVSKNDIAKAAYYPTPAQVNALTETGYIPGVYPSVTIVPLHILGSDETIEASYYASLRKGSGRPPEKRMGRDDFMKRIATGERLAIMTDGKDAFICRALPGTEEVAGDAREAYEKIATGINEGIPMEELMRRLSVLSPKPAIRNVETRIYNRNPEVVAFVRRRSGYRCEKPGCRFEGFEKTDGEPYIETHHIVPLATGGEDTIHNSAAACPNCHRALHYSKDSIRLSKEVNYPAYKAGHLKQF